MKAWLVFVDESAFSQRLPIRATWAPRGRTPRLVEPFNWEKLSGIGAVLTQPDGQRPRWLLALHQGSVRSAQVVRFSTPCDAIGDARQFCSGTAYLLIAAGSRSKLCSTTAPGSGSSHCPPTRRN